jgi:hypothetical protein
MTLLLSVLLRTHELLIIPAVVGGVRHRVVKPTRQTLAATVARRARLKVSSRPGRATVISVSAVAVTCDELPYLASSDSQ